MSDYCPYCGAGAGNVGEEIAHMEAEHPDVIRRRLEDAGLEPPVLDAAQRSFEHRRAHSPEQIDNGALAAGAPLIFYCELCGWPSDFMPEDFFLASPRRRCSECEAGVRLGAIRPEQVPR